MFDHKAKCLWWTTKTKRTSLAVPILCAFYPSPALLWEEFSWGKKAKSGNTRTFLYGWLVPITTKTLLWTSFKQESRVKISTDQVFQVRNAFCCVAPGCLAQPVPWRCGGFLTMFELLLPGSAPHRHRRDSDLPALQGPLPLCHAVQPRAPHSLVLWICVFHAAGQKAQRSLEVRTTGEHTHTFTHTQTHHSFRGNELPLYFRSLLSHKVSCIYHDPNPHHYLLYETLRIMKVE